MKDKEIPNIVVNEEFKTTEVKERQEGEEEDDPVKASTSSSSSPRRKAKKRKASPYDDLRVPENLETKKRKLLNSFVPSPNDATPIAGTGDMTNPFVNGSDESLVTTTSSPTTPISTPSSTAPAYHYSSKNVDTTHIYVKVNEQSSSHDAVWEHDDESGEEDNVSEASTASPPLDPRFAFNEPEGDIIDRALMIQQRIKNFDRDSNVPPSPTVGKVGIQLVKQINTQYIFEKFKDANIRNPIMSPGSIELHWDRRPERVLVVKQVHTDRTDRDFERVVKYLYNEKKVSVYVEPLVYEKLQWDFLKTFDMTLYNESQSTIDPNTIGANGGYKNLHKLLDLIICLGGDGTILHTASMFPSAVPPILGFNLGSLGFLTAFDIQRYKEYIDHVFNGSVYLSTRMRLTCKIRRSNGAIEPQRYQILNDIVVDRGQCPFLCNLECYCNNTHITTVQADGLILATPTGSTAYSMSAGGSIVHPNVNCLLLTPICPHSLSFRPIILPDSTVLTIKVPQESRGTAWISFDGKNRQELQRGDSVIVTTSIWPVPLICKTEETSEWFMNLTDIFNWNKRERQKSFASSADDDSNSDNE